MVVSSLDGGVEGCGEPGECQEKGKAADECGGAAGGEGESDAKSEAEDGGGGECDRNGFFDFLDHLFLCQIPSDAGFLVPVADRLGRAVGGLRK
jgi:hypothetical protein